MIPVMHTCLSGQQLRRGRSPDMCIFPLRRLVGVCILTWYDVCLCACVRARSRALLCARVQLGGGVAGRGREARRCSLIFWERQGGVVDPPAPFSLQLDLVEFQQLHPLTKQLFVIFPRRTNTTATRRGAPSRAEPSRAGERREDVVRGQEEEEGRDCSGLCAAHQ